MPSGAPGECQAVANVVDCFRVDPCKTQGEGTSCDFMGEGICKNNECKPACDGLSAWDSCTIPFGWNTSVGVCAPQPDGSLQCRAPDPCDMLSTGDACQSDGEDGVCRSEEHTSELESRENLVCRL